MTHTMLVTGGARGIGRAVAIAGGSLGWSVGINYAGNEAAAAETVARVEAAGGRGLAIRGDVASEADVIAMFDETQAAFGPVTALVNNAGIVGPKSTLADMDLARMQRIFDVNVTGAYLVAREGARRMPTDRGGKGGAIVNVSSVAARLGAPGQYLDYAGSKGAIDSLTAGLAKELAPGGVRVNGVRPGIIETEIHASGGEPNRAAELGPSAPIGRAGTPAEVAETVIWLLSEAASFVTGATLDVSGGR
ncbi:MAG: SDR family oxidoreductase [Paracoccaceae bacterium]|nr:SDR family oxidoreductase [Paracoccaceae bacterium]